MKKLIYIFVLLAVILILYFARKENYSGRPIVVLHYTNWCGWCKKMKPIWEKVKAANPNMTFQEVDEDKAKNPWIKSYPTILLYTNKVHKYEGGPDFEKLNAWVRIWARSA